MKENVLERNARMDTDRKIADFRVKQQMDYAFKVKYARIRAWEFYNHPDVAGNCYVAVGGLDSITLLLFLRNSRYCIFCNRLGRRTRMQDRAHLR